MKRYASLLAATLLCVSALPAHAVSNPDFAVNSINSSFRTNVVSAKSIGGGTGGGITQICNSSPENATVLLALLSGAGLLAGRRMRRVRSARIAIS